MPGAAALPLAGLKVVEVAAGLSMVGAGLATQLPGSLLRDLGADVTRVEWSAPSTLDEGIEFGVPWSRGKEVLRIDADDHDRATATIRSLVASADVVFLAGSEKRIEQAGLGAQDLARANPRLVQVRIRPSFNASGPIPDVELLLHARTGLLTQIIGHRPSPVFCDLAVGSAGAGLTAAVGALARLYAREESGVGGWAETSLYDGLFAILPMIIGHVEVPSASTRALWEGQGPETAPSLQCADGEYVQLWFGAKGAYESFLEAIGDEPSPAGYNAEMLNGAIGDRSRRWAEIFAAHDRAWWLERLSGRAFRIEPVLRPGEALLDSHVREIGLSIEHHDPHRGRVSLLGPLVEVAGSGSGVGSVAIERGSAPAGLPTGSTGYLSGVRVLDFAAFLAGPVTPQILAELGADVIKVEPTTGDVHRSMEPLFVAGQRGKRSLALDLKAPQAREVLEGLFRWADVVHHNSRLGLAERLGYGEGQVRAVNPDVVYSHASGFGSSGPRAHLAANDHLMQALSGIEAAQGGNGRPPTCFRWGPVDVTSGWISACAVLAGLYARRKTGEGQSVRSTLLGAGMALKSGVFVADGAVVPGPMVDDRQTGYGAAYRIYQGGDGAWFALAVLDRQAWTRLREVLGDPDLPDRPPPLRMGTGERQPAEERLEALFATKAAAVWVSELRAAGVEVEPVVEVDRAEFVAQFLNDPVNQQLGRVAAFEWGPRGRLEQPGFLLRFGPKPAPGAPRQIPALGEHSEEVLATLGFAPEAVAELVASNVVGVSS